MHLEVVVTNCYSCPFIANKVGGFCAHPRSPKSSPIAASPFVGELPKRCPLFKKQALIRAEAEVWDGRLGPEDSGDTDEGAAEHGESTAALERDTGGERPPQKDDLQQAPRAYVTGCRPRHRRRVLCPMQGRIY